MLASPTKNSLIQVTARTLPCQFLDGSRDLDKNWQVRGKPFVVLDLDASLTVNGSCGVLKPDTVKLTGSE